MPRFRHVIRLGGYDLPGHLARTLCGRVVAYGRQPNVPRGDADFCARCHALDQPKLAGANPHRSPEGDYICIARGFPNG